MNGRLGLRTITLACAASALLAGCAALDVPDDCGGGARRPVNLHGSASQAGALAPSLAESTPEGAGRKAPGQGVL